MKIFIVDDEKNSREVLKELISQFFIEGKIVGEASNIEDAFLKINSQKPDLVLLDIQMPTGNGFNLLKKFEDVFFDVIFITSYDQYAINAIKFNALDYLLKPVDINLLKSALDKAFQSLNRKRIKKIQYINLLNDIENVSPTEKKIVIHEKETVKLLKVTDVMYFEGDINYTYIYTKTERYTSSKNIKEFEEYLSNNTNFVRSHRKYIINMNYIVSYSKGEPFYLIMENGSQLEASRRKKAEVLEKLKKRN